jgi:lipopolysaccharide transport system ATP-binding protein
MLKTTIKVSNISKKYILHHEKPTLAESIFKTKEEFWALKNINIEARKGETIGIIGHNGAGKTTLLKIIGGITQPTTGNINAYGKIAPLIDLEAGFHPDLTGKENVFVQGLILGMRKHEINRKLPQIVKFSGIQKFIDTPLKSYSSGMKLRLGFSIAIFSDPNIFLIDEVITAGDMNFREKSYRKIEELAKQGKTIIFSSHHISMILKLCKKTVLLENGKVKLFGKTEKVVKHYQS